MYIHLQGLLWTIVPSPGMQGSRNVTQQINDQRSSQVTKCLSVFKSVEELDTLPAVTFSSFLALSTSYDVLDKTLFSCRFTSFIPIGSFVVGQAMQSTAVATIRVNNVLRMQYFYHKQLVNKECSRGPPFNHSTKRQPMPTKTSSG